jgi:hypothetical protein
LNSFDWLNWFASDHQPIEPIKPIKLEPISKNFLSAILPFWKPVSVEGRVKKLSLFEGLGPSLTILAPRNGNAKMANQKRKKVF